ncbi:putative membrane protein [Propionispora sp. 2/2-37]|nr:putative membrane protein [Propionispora sp. 2/2-37]
MTFIISKAGIIHKGKRVLIGLMLLVVLFYLLIKLVNFFWAVTDNEHNLDHLMERPLRVFENIVNTS